jgi:DNA-binding MarR family transcriptional regulator
MEPLPFRSVVRALVRALGVLDDARTPCGAELSVREAYALTALRAAEAQAALITQTELQTVLGVDKSNTTRLVQELVASGRLEQRAGEEDRRVRTLHLTAKGRRMAENVEQRSLARFDRVLARIPASEHATVVRSLELLRAALEGEDRE